MEFPYQNILDAKKQREKSLQMDLSALQRRIERWQSERRELVEDQRRALRQLDDRSGRPNRARSGELRRLRGFLAQISRCSAAVAGLEEEKSEVREKLQDVARSRKLLEKHRDKLAERARDRFQRRQRKMVENHAIYSFSSDREKK